MLATIEALLVEDAVKRDAIALARPGHECLHAQGLERKTLGLQVIGFPHDGAYLAAQVIEMASPDSFNLVAVIAHFVHEPVEMMPHVIHGMRQ